jgi:hypothetical protein
MWVGSSRELRRELANADVAVSHRLIRTRLYRSVVASLLASLVKWDWQRAVATRACGARRFGNDCGCRGHGSPPASVKVADAGSLLSLLWLLTFTAVRSGDIRVFPIGWKLGKTDEGVEAEVF